MKLADLPAHVRPEWVAQARPYDNHLDMAHPIGPFQSEIEPSSSGSFRADLHRGLEFGVLLAGEREIHFSDFSMTIGPGEVWLCSVWEPHAWRVPRLKARSAGAVFLPDAVEGMIHQEVPWLDMFSVSPAQRPQVKDAPLRAEACALGECLFREVSQQAPGWEAIVRLQLAHLLILLCRNWAFPVIDEHALLPHAGYLSRVMPALTLVNERPGQRVSCREAAAACGLSASRFHHVFRQVMGASFEDFCRTSRLEFAAHLLLSTELDVSSIATRTEFVDASHLHRAFSRRFGQTPGQYRRSQTRRHDPSGADSP
jgi:AraC-like DNA-binding protein